MFMNRCIRVATIFAITAGLVAVAQPAFALSSAPDHTWGVKGKAYALAQYGDTMFVGGALPKVLDLSGKATSIANIAALSISTGNYLPSFHAQVTNTGSTAKPEVDALAVSSDGTKLYIGGSFDTVDGQPRQNFAAVDLATGTQVDPTVTAQPNSKVWAIVATSNLVYLGGTFVKVDGLDRQHLAAISASTGALSTTWAPSALAGTDPCPSQFPTGTNCGPVSNGGTGHVHSLSISADGTGLFIGGNFYYINGTPRNALAEVSLTNGSLFSWKVPWHTIPSEGPGNPYVGPNVVWAVLPTSTRVYIGYGRTPNGIEAFTSTTSTSSGECAAGCSTSLWTDGTPGNAESLALSPDGTRLFAGGHFGTAVLDYKISSCGSTVYAHGLISVNPTNGAYFCDWTPQMIPFGGQSAPGSGVNPPNYVGGWAMQMTGNALFVAGSFTSISGVSQSGIARFTLVGTPPPPPSPPTVTSFLPATGPPGTSVTVTGTSFTGTTDVSFGATPAVSYTVDSDTQITATVPVGALTGPISVTNGNGTGKSSTNFKVTVVLSAFSPAAAPVGSTVTLTGVGFTVATGVTFGSTVASSFSVDSDTQITTTVPAGAVTAPIKITTAKNGVGKSSTSFKVTVLGITSVTPNAGTAGDQVIIAGSGFTGATHVQFNGVDATFFIGADDQITAIVPTGATTGFVTVTTPSGSAQSGSMFTVT
jgi:hypothetical protein